MNRNRPHKEVAILKRQKPPLCKCGCKQRTKWSKWNNCWNTYIRNHTWIRRHHSKKTKIKMSNKRRGKIKIPREIRMCAKEWCNKTFKCKTNSKQKYCPTSCHKMPREIRVCICGCGEKFECKITNKQKYIKQSHYWKTVIGVPHENKRGENNCKWIEREIRICACGCDKTFKCRITDKQKYINRNHVRESLTGVKKIERETRICACGCNEIFECKVNSKQKYINPKHTYKGISGKNNILWRGGNTLERRRCHQKKRQESARDNTKNLADSYIKSLLCGKTNLKSADIPSELIKAKREQLKLYRLIKKGA